MTITDPLSKFGVGSRFGGTNSQRYADNLTTSGIMASDFNTSEQNIIGSITKLQEIEKALVSQLQSKLATDPNDPSVPKIIEQMNSLATLRLNLYSNLSEMGDFYASNVNGTATSLADQTMALAVVENELNASKKRLNFVEDQRLSKLRLVEINEYYGKKYNEHTKIMKTLVILFAVILVLTVLFNSYILPESIYYFCILVTGVVGGIFVGNMIVKSMKRSAMNYDEYKWYFDISGAPQLNIAGASISGDPWAVPRSKCIGEGCCDPLTETYDPVLNICVSNCSSTSGASSPSNYASDRVDFNLSPNDITDSIAGFAGNSFIT